MARKRADILAAAPKPSGRDLMWRFMRANGAGFTLRLIQDMTDIPRHTIRSYVRSLIAGGYVAKSGTRVERNSQRAIVFKIVKDAGREAPRLTRDGKPVIQGMARDHMWRSMKMMSAAGDFNYRELAFAARTETVHVAEIDAADYVKHLHSAGYLAITVEASRGQGKRIARYRLVNNTGPRAPMVQRLKTVFDPNLGRIVWHEEADR